MCDYARPVIPLRSDLFSTSHLTTFDSIIKTLTRASHSSRRRLTKPPASTKSFVRSFPMGMIQPDDDDHSQPFDARPVIPLRSIPVPPTRPTDDHLQFVSVKPCVISGIRLSDIRRPERQQVVTRSSRITSTEELPTGKRPTQNRLREKPPYRPLSPCTPSLTLPLHIFPHISPQTIENLFK